MASNLTKSQQLLYHIVKTMGEVDDKTKLAKLEYFSDFIHFAFHDHPISDKTNVYQKRKQGPLSVAFNEDLNVLTEMGFLKEKPKFNYTVKKEIDTDLSDEELKTVQYVIDKYGKCSYNELIDICHEQIPYNSAKEGGVIEYFTSYNLVDGYSDYGGQK